MHDTNRPVVHTGESAAKQEGIRAALDELLRMLARELARRIYEEQLNVKRKPSAL